MPPTKFHGLVQRVAAGLGDKTRFPDLFWDAKLAMLQAFLAVAAKHDAIYHQSIMGNRLLIAERDVLQAQLVIYLDQIVFFLEMAAVTKPEVLSASGFDLGRDRRGHGRSNVANAALSAAKNQQGEGEGGTSS